MCRTGRFFAVVMAVLAAPLAAEPAHAGKLTIITDPPDAMIFVNSQYRGLSPITVDDAGRDPLAIRATKKGRRDSSRMFKPDGTDQVLRVSLEPAEGCSLAVSSLPSGAAVFINGRHSGKTPLALDDLQPDEYDVRLELRDYLPSTQTVRLAAGEPGKVDVRLVPALETMLRGKIERDPANLALHCALADARLARHDVAEAADALLEGLARWDCIEPLDPRRNGLRDTLGKIIGVLNGRKTLYEKCTGRIAREPDRLGLYTPLRDFYRDPSYRETLGEWFAAEMEKPHSRLAADSLGWAFGEFIARMRTKGVDEKLQFIESLAARHPQAGISAWHRAEAFADPARQGRSSLEQFMAGIPDDERMGARLRILEHGRPTGAFDQLARDVLRDEPATPGAIECILPKYAQAIGVQELDRLAAEHPGLVLDHSARFARAYSLLREPKKAGELAPTIYGLPEETFHPAFTQNDEAEKAYRENSNNRDKLFEIIEKYPRTGAACRAYHTVWVLLDPVEVPTVIRAHMGEYRARTQDLLHLANVLRYNLLDSENAVKAFQEYVDARRGFRYTTDDAMALFQIGSIFLTGLDDAAGAADYLGRHLELADAAGDEPAAAAYVLAGEAWRRLGQFEKAFECWRALCERNPDSREAIHARMLAVQYLGMDIVGDDE